jgi:hypothetical protein
MCCYLKSSFGLDWKVWSGSYRYYLISERLVVGLSSLLEDSQWRQERSMPSLFHSKLLGLLLFSFVQHRLHLKFIPASYGDQTKKVRVFPFAYPIRTSHKAGVTKEVNVTEIRLHTSI